MAKELSELIKIEDKIKYRLIFQKIASLKEFTTLN